MRKKALILAAVGFPLGVLMGLAIAFFGRSTDGNLLLYSPALLERMGSGTGAALAQLLACGLYGAACMAGSALYEVERWPLALATALHYLIIVLGYLLCYWLLSWKASPRETLFILGAQTIGFFLVWLFMCLRYKAQVRKLNELQKQHNQEIKENGGENE